MEWVFWPAPLLSKINQEDYPGYITFTQEGLARSLLEIESYQPPVEMTA